MALSAEIVIQRMKAFAEAFRKVRVRVTHQRTEIFRELAGTEEHPHAETIFARVRERIPAVSLDTIYRTLATLEEQGLIRKVEVLSGGTRFDANMKPHHHLLCTECGWVRDFYSEEFSSFKVPKEVRSWGQITSAHVQLRGICRKCRRKG